MGTSVAKLLLVGGFLTVASLGAGAGQAEPFDKPLHKRVLDMGRSQHLMRTDNRHVTVTCWYYSRFMIKEQNDPGLKGAELIALAPVRSGRSPRCSPARQPEEKQFNEWSSEFKTLASWNGYFAGVKRNLVFLERPDGDENSGIPFSVFDADTQTKLFEDSVLLGAGGERELNFLPATGNQVSFRFLRVASTGCSIPKSGESCWNKIQQQTGLIQSPMPRCSDYEGEEAGTAASVIAYLVEVSLYPKPAIRPLGGSAMCYPAE